MPRLDVDVEREHKRSRSDREKIIRLVILFCVIAAITALIICWIVPSGDSGTEEAAAEENTAESSSGAAEENAPEESDSETDEKNSARSSDDNSRSSSSDKNAGDSKNGSENSGKIDSSSGTGGKNSRENINPAKYDPSTGELFTQTGKLSAMLKDGSWKKSNFAVSHIVAPNEYVSTLERKYHNTRDFIRIANNLDEKYTIGLNDKLYFLRADSWQIIISVKNGTLQLDRVVNGNAIPFAIFNCRIKPDAKTRNDLVICSHRRKPVYRGEHGTRFKHGDPENPYGEYLLAIANEKKPDAPVYYLSIHDCKDENSEATPLKNGATILNHEDISLLYILAPDGTPVRIVE